MKLQFWQYFLPLSIYVHKCTQRRSMQFTTKKKYAHRSILSLFSSLPTKAYAWPMVGVVIKNKMWTKKKKMMELLENELGFHWSVRMVKT